MKILLLLSLAALVGVAFGCSPVSEGALELAGLGYGDGKYYRFFGGLAASKEEKKFVGFFNISSAKNGYIGYHYVHFDLNDNVGYHAEGTTKDDAKCVKFNITHPELFRTIHPKNWPNSKVLHNSTITASKVPVSVYSGNFKCENASVHLSGIFDDSCVPVIIKKRYCAGDKHYGGAIVFGGFHEPKPCYFKLPDVCVNAEFASPSEKRSRVKPNLPTGVLNPTS